MAKVDPRVTYSRDAKHSSLISLRWSSKKYGFHVCPTPTNVHHHGNRLTNKSLSLLLILLKLFSFWMRHGQSKVSLYRHKNAQLDQLLSPSLSPSLEPPTQLPPHSERMRQATRAASCYTRKRKLRRLGIGEKMQLRPSLLLCSKLSLFKELLWRVLESKLHLVYELCVWVCVRVFEAEHGWKRH